ncbi:MAG TPA: hypothetical protein VGR35_02205 [Tepidisphaeraceae bacterium]|nr:hypothetical protein [Tepidisphaeraceae bacterium]
MFDPIVTILIFVAVIAITALLFGGWLIVTIISAFCRLLMLPFRARRGSRQRMVAGEMTSPRCANERCRAENAPVASFCRRCGTPMRHAQHVPVRRVAMW